MQSILVEEKTIEKKTVCIFAIATTLDKEGAESVWTPVQWEPAQRLAIRQLMLGHTAKAGEYNVIEVRNSK